MPNYTEIDKKHVVNVGTSGTFTPTYKFHTSTEDLDNMKDYILENNIKRIAIYAHGGLNSEEQGLKSANAWLESMKNTSTYPLTIVWESGLLDSLFKEYIGDGIHAEVYESFNRIIEYLKKYIEYFEGIFSANVLKSNKSTDDFTNAMFQQMEEELRTLPELADDLAILNTYSQSKRGEKGLFKYIIIKMIIKAFKNAIQRKYADTDHGLYTTVIEELMRELGIASVAKTAWIGMKNKAIEAFENDDVNETLAGDYLLKTLNTIKEKNQNFTIDLIGHSAGAIVQTNLIAHATKNYKNLKFNNVSFLAPAVTMEHFNENVVRNFQNINFFRIYTMYDSFEQNDKLAFILYPKSLLYFISGLLEYAEDEAILGMERHIKFNLEHHSENEKAVQQFLKAENTQNVKIIYSKTPTNTPIGEQTSATKHGDFFPENGDTMSSLVHISTH